MLNFLFILSEAGTAMMTATTESTAAAPKTWAWNDSLSLALSIAAFVVSIIPIIYHLIPPVIHFDYLEPNEKMLDPAAYSSIGSNIINAQSYHYYHFLVSQSFGIKPIEDSIVMLDSIIYNGQQVFINVPLHWMNQEEYQEGLTRRTILKKYQVLDLFKENCQNHDISLVSSTNKSYFIDAFNKSTAKEKNISFIIVVDSKTKTCGAKVKITISLDSNANQTSRAYSIKIKKIKNKDVCVVENN